MKRPSHQRRYFCTIVIALFGASAAFQVLLSLHPENEARYAMTNVFQRRFRADVDRSLLKKLEQLGPDGNVLLLFELSNQLRVVKTSLIETVYHRTVYYLYPRRLRLGEQSHVVNNARDLLTNRYTYSKEWISESGITSVLIVRIDQDGKVSLITRQISDQPPTESADKNRGNR